MCVNLLLCLALLGCSGGFTENPPYDCGAAMDLANPPFVCLCFRRDKTPFLSVNVGRDLLLLNMLTDIHGTSICVFGSPAEELARVATEGL